GLREGVIVAAGRDRSCLLGLLTECFGTFLAFTCTGWCTPALQDDPDLAGLVFRTPLVRLAGSVRQPGCSQALSTATANRRFQVPGRLGHGPGLPWGGAAAPVQAEPPQPPPGRRGIGCLPADLVCGHLRLPFEASAPARGAGVQRRSRAAVG